MSQMHKYGGSAPDALHALLALLAMLLYCTAALPYCTATEEIVIASLLTTWRRGLSRHHDALTPFGISPLPLALVRARCTNPFQDAPTSACFDVKLRPQSGGFPAWCETQAASIIRCETLPVGTPIRQQATSNKQRKHVRLQLQLVYAQLRSSPLCYVDYLKDVCMYCTEYICACIRTFTASYYLGLKGHF